MRKLLTTLPFAMLGAAVSMPTQADELPFTIGGHIRVNYGYQDWLPSEQRSGLEFESFKLNISGETDQFTYKAEYRWYENVDFDTIRYADLTYTVDEELSITGGITQVPFGLLPFASNNFWFSGNYYIGLEDDYDAGLVANYTPGNWNIHAAYFFNDEYSDAANFGRYSFDVADFDEYRNKEDGQVNLRASYNAELYGDATTDIGVSYQYGDIVNLDTRDRGDMTAYAVHVRHVDGPVGVDLQYTDFDYDVAAPDGVPTDRIAMSSFDSAFLQTAEGKSYIANLNYTIPYEFDTISELKCYTEYSRIESDVEAGRDSSQWVNGCSFGWEKLFVYVDSIHGKNMWFSGGPGVGLDLGGLQDTTHRVNVNIGLYF